MTTTARTLLTMLLVAATSAACTSGGADPATPEPTSTSSATAVQVEPVVRTVTLDGTPVDLEVGPLAVHDDVAVLRLAAPTEPPALRMAFWEVFESISSPGPSGVRLVDVDAGTVLAVARTAADGPVMSKNGSPEGTATDAAQAAAGEGTEIIYVAFAVPDADTVDVLLPHAGWFDDVPFVDASAAGTLSVPPSELAEDAVAERPVLDLETYTEQVGGQVRARQTATEVTVDVSSDVLFATDSADLGPEAEAALAAAGAQVAAYAGGRLTVVGHTDDVADEAHNLDLSQRRAQSVAQRLGGLVDLSAFEVSVDGRGESEPAVEGTSDEARSLNRRVEVTLVPTADAEVDPVAPTDASELPEATGPTATGLDGVTVQDGEDHFSVRLPEVRRDGRYLVGELELENLGTGQLKGDVLAVGAWDSRGSFDPSLQQAATNVSLLVGRSRLFPVDYLRAAESDRREPLTDRSLVLEPGATGVVTVVWPDPGTETVAVEVASREIAAFGGISVGAAAFRLTDVPVVDAPQR
ncbi:OmpA family protein [Cellulomonas sp. P5_C5]